MKSAKPLGRVRFGAKKEIVKGDRNSCSDRRLSLFCDSPKLFAIFNFCNYCNVSDRARYFFREIPSCERMREF
ncbi:hypothetical protein HC931_22910 [Candidatus Gracilibacteria bacterium]|nr:hypothetical protein [Candidatus Gracilibacteria bacterium]